MQSKISCFNTIVKKNLLRFWPLWGINVFFWVIAPIAVTLSWSNFGSRNAAEILYGGCTGGLPAYFLVYSCGVAMAVWSYLYTGKSVGLMHSLPVTRNRLFAASFVSGLIMEIIPVAAGGALFALLCILKGAFVLVPFLISAVITVAEAFIFFSIATLMAHLTGNILGLPVLHFVLNFLAVLLEFVLGAYFRCFTYGLTGNYEAFASFLSPVVRIYEKVRYIEGVQNSYTDALGVTIYEYDSTFKEYSPGYQYIEGWGTLAAYAAVGIVLTGLALFLYQKRRSETAGEVVSARILRPVALACFTACAALTGGLILYYIFGGGEQEGSSVSLMSLCMLMSSFIGYFGGQMLIKRKLRVFNKKTFMGFGAAAIICVFFLAVLRGGCFGRESYVPDVRDIKAVELHTYGNGNDDFYSEDPAMIEALMSLHHDLIAQKKEILESGKRFPNGVDTDNSIYAGGGRIVLAYHLKNRIVEREYRISTWSDRHELDGILDKVHSFTDNSDVMLRRMYYGQKIGIQGVSYNDSYLSDAGAKEFYDAVIEDIKEGNYRSCCLDSFNDSTGFARFEIIIYDDNVFGRWDYEELMINGDMKHTMDYIKAHGL